MTMMENLDIRDCFMEEFWVRWIDSWPENQNHCKAFWRRTFSSTKCSNEIFSLRKLLDVSHFVRTALLIGIGRRKNKTRSNQCLLDGGSGEGRVAFEVDKEMS